MGATCCSGADDKDIIYNQEVDYDAEMLKNI